jgi:hypothetical protein
VKALLRLAYFGMVVYWLALAVRGIWQALRSDS